MDPAKFQRLCAMSEKAMAEVEAKKTNIVFQDTISDADFKKLHGHGDDGYMDQEVQATAYGIVSVKLSDGFEGDSEWNAGNRVLSERDVQDFTTALKQYLRGAHGTGRNADDFRYHCKSPDVDITVKLRCAPPTDTSAVKPEAAVPIRAVFRYSGECSDNWWKPVTADIGQFCKSTLKRVCSNIIRKAAILYYDTASECSGR